MGALVTVALPEKAVSLHSSGEPIGKAPVNPLVKARLGKGTAVARAAGVADFDGDVVPDSPQAVAENVSVAIATHATMTPRAFTVLPLCDFAPVATVTVESTGGNGLPLGRGRSVQAPASPPATQSR